MTGPVTGKFPSTRMRRLRKSPFSRRLARERALSVEQRLALHDALAAIDDDEADTVANEYRGYSAWLVRLLKDNANVNVGQNSPALLKPKARTALNDIHETLRSEHNDREPADDVFTRIKQAWQHLEILR